MASSERQSSQRSENLTPRCQKRSCSHRHCPHQGCSHTCPNIFWCPQCTRFWCEDCWEDVDAHQPIEVEVAEMKDHEKTILKLTGGVKSILRPKGTSSEEDPTKRLLMARQEQENVIQVPHTPGTSPNQADQMELPGLPTSVSATVYQTLLMQLGQQNKKRLLMARQEQENVTQAPHAPGTSPNQADQMELPGLSTPVSATDYTDYQTRLMQLGQQNKKRLLMARQEQENVTQAPHAPDTSPNSADQMEQGTPKRRHTGLPRSPTPVSATQDWALQDYQMQLMRVEQYNKKRLLMARQEQDNLK